MFHPNEVPDSNEWFASHRQCLDVKWSTTSRHEPKFTLCLQLLLQVEVVYESKKCSLLFFPPWVQTMYRLKSSVILRWLVRRASVWRQREEEDSCGAVPRSAVWVMIEVQLLFKPTGTLETQGWQLQAKTVHVGESTEIIVGITIHLHKRTILFFSFFCYVEN